MLYLELMDEENARVWFEYAASLHGDSNAARFWARFVPLVYHREDDAILLALTGDAPGELHNARYSLVPALHSAAVAAGSEAALRERLAAEAPGLNTDRPNVRPRLGEIALALTAMSSSEADRRQLLQATGVGVRTYPDLYARLSLTPRWQVLNGDVDAAIEALQRTLDDGWLRSWWLVRQSPAFDPLRDLPAFKAISRQVRTHAREEAARLANAGPAAPE
jgi:hypothetical protein